MKTSKELEAEIEKLKRWVNDHGSRMKLFDYFAEKVDKRQIERGKLLQDVEERLVEIEKADRDLERMGDLEAAQDAERDRVTRLYKDIQRLSTQEDKIKSLEGLEKSNNVYCQHLDRRLSEVEPRDKQIQSLQEKVKRLADDFVTQDEQIIAKCGDWRSLNKRIEKLENLQDFHTPHNGIIDQRFCAAHNRMDKICRRLTALESKPQDCRREVIKRARHIVYGVWSASRMIRPEEGNLVLQALTIADQSLEGGE